MDEADNLGLKVQPEALETELGIPVILMSAVFNREIRELKQTILQCLSSPTEVISEVISTDLEVAR